jgi:putative hemolysin
VKLFSAILRLKKISDRDIVTEEEIMMMVDAGNETGSIEESQAEMISNIFEFSDTPVSDVMTHRTGVVAVNADTGVNEIVKKAIDSGFSRLPLCINDIDHIYGIICVKDLLTLVGSGEISENVKAESFFRETIFLPESATCRNAFRRMTEKKMQMAVVMDEYGGTAGIVTLEDLIETIVGNIQDEYDDEREDIVKISDDVFIIDGLASPDDVFPVLELSLPEENEYDTMSAFLIDISGKIPEKNEKCFTEYGNFRFTSLATKDTLITRLKAEKLSD